MDLKQLEAFAWAARLGSFSKAGKRMELTQPTISAHIGSLERELNTRLFVRSAKRVSLTPAGDKLLHYTEEILRLRDEAVADLSVPEHVRWWEGLFGVPPVPKKVVSFVGAGGKTTFLFSLAHELAEQGYRVAVTTTTRIFRPDAGQSRYVVTDGSLQSIEQALADGGLVTVGVPAEGGKLAAPAEEVLHYLQRAADFLLIEADGSRCLPVKVPRAGEPVLFSGTNAVAAICGMRCQGEAVGSVCHRAELAQELLGVQAEHCLTPQDVAELLYRSYAGCAEEVTFVLNQADNIYLRKQAAETARYLLGLGAKRVLVSSFLSRRMEVFLREAPPQ